MAAAQPADFALWLGLVAGLPVVAGLIALRLRGRAADTVAVAGITFSMLALVAVVFAYLNDPGAGRMAMTWNWLPWISSSAATVGFVLDQLSLLMLIVILTVGVAVVVFSTEYLSPRNVEHPAGNDKGRYYFWLLLFVTSMAGLAVSPNLLQMFIFWEMTTLCSWALIGFYDTKAAVRSGYKALVYTSAGGVAFVLALLVMYVSTGSFEFSQVGVAGAGVYLLLLIAAWSKAAQIPFFTWLPEAMEAPTPISAYLHAAAMVKAGVFLIGRVILDSYQSLQEMATTWNLGGLHLTITGESLGIFTAVLALITILVGLYFYFSQDDLKKLLAYSTITHLGYVLFGMGLGLAGFWIGYLAALVHIIAHAYAKTLLFLGVGAISYATGERRISRLGGLASRMPFTTCAIFIGIFALVGIPPLACFWSKFFLLAATIELGGFTGLVLLLPFVAEAVLAFLWFVLVGQKVFFGPPRLAPGEGHAPPPILNIVLGTLALLCLFAPLIALPFLPAAPG